MGSESVGAETSFAPGEHGSVSNTPAFGASSGGFSRGDNTDNAPTHVRLASTMGTKASGRRKASPWWLLPVVALTALPYAGTIAPRTELLVKLACHELYPTWDLAPNNTVLASNTTHNLPIRAQFTPRSNITVPGLNVKCSDDVSVQRAVARLNTAISTFSGLLSVLTTGWWTQLSDRVGRVRILTITALSGTMVDIVFVLVVRYSDRFPSGYHWLVVSNMIDGLLGGWPTAVATSHAYVSDCVPAAERSQWFSLWTGVIFGGMALGPSLGSFVISSSQNVMVIFYLVLASDLIYIVFVAFVLPESMSPEALHNASESRKRSKDGQTSLSWKSLSKKLLALFEPLIMFLPRTASHPGARRRLDWNPTLIGLAYALHAVNSGSYSFKYQYATKAFAWSSTQMGNWLSLLGILRAFHLVLLLPLILKGLHAYRARRAAGREPSLDDSAENKAKAIDLLVSRASLGTDVSSYVASALVTTSSAFVATSSLLSFGGGYPPAIQSLALALTQAPSKVTPDVHSAAAGQDSEGERTDTPASDDTSRLLGAMSIVYSLCSQILGPSLFGMTFVATVAYSPRAIFWLSAVLNLAALLSLLLVRLAPTSQNKQDDAEYVLLDDMDS